MRPDDKRYLCNRCADDYTSAGYTLTRTHGDDKQECDKCEWHISKEYKIKPKVREVVRMFGEERRGET